MYTQFGEQMLSAYRRNSVSTKHLFTILSISFLRNFFFHRNRCRLLLFFLTFPYKFHDSFSMLHGIASFSVQLWLERGVGVEEPSTVLSFCLYQIDIKVVV